MSKGVAVRKPWDGVIPPQDIDVFKGRYLPIERPMGAGARPAVIVVDMTAEFVGEKGPDGHSGGSNAQAVKATASLLEAARAADVPIFYTKRMAVPVAAVRPVDRGRWKRPESEYLPPEPLDHRDRERHRDGDRIVDELAPADDDVVIHKGEMPSAFFGTRLASYLTYHLVDTTIITGMTTSGCVRASVVDAFQHNYRVLVPYQCVADRSGISHAVSLFDLHMKYADVVDTQDVIRYLADLPSVRDGAVAGRDG